MNLYFNLSKQPAIDRVAEDLSPARLQSQSQTTYQPPGSDVNDNPIPLFREVRTKREEQSKHSEGKRPASGSPFS